MQFCRGLGRKLSIPLLVLSIIGWLLFVIAFGGLNHTNNFFNDYRQLGLNHTSLDGSPIFRQDTSIPALRASLLWFPHWCVLIVAPFLYTCTIIHLIIGRFFTGIFTKFLTCFYLVTGGAVVYDSGVLLFGSAPRSMAILFDLTNNPSNWLTNLYWGLWPLLEFVGVLITIFFLTLFVMMWPLFSEKYTASEYFDEEYEEEDKTASAPQEFQEEEAADAV